MDFSPPPYTAGSKKPFPVKISWKGGLAMTWAFPGANSLPLQGDFLPPFLGNATVFITAKVTQITGDVNGHPCPDCTSLRQNVI
jgi:hypothetical protein